MTAEWDVGDHSTTEGFLCISCRRVFRPYRNSVGSSALISLARETGVANRISSDLSRILTATPRYAEEPKLSCHVTMLLWKG